MQAELAKQIIHQGVEVVVGMLGFIYRLLQPTGGLCLLADTRWKRLHIETLGP